MNTSAAEFLQAGRRIEIYLTCNERRHSAGFRKDPGAPLYRRAICPCNVKLILEECMGRRKTVHTTDLRVRFVIF